MAPRIETETSSAEGLEFNNEKVQHRSLEKAQFESHEFPALDHALDRRITRKFDFHIVPWLFGLWLLAFIDRSNIGNARIVGLATDLKLDGNKFNIVSLATAIDSHSIDNWALRR